MGVSISVWRQSIGLFNSTKWISSGCCVSSDILSTFHAAAHLFFLLCVLLVIGGVELNPGPTAPDFLKPCSLCPFKARTAEQHIYHQRIHANASNFVYNCPFPRCARVCRTFTAVSSHLCYHTTRRDELIGEPAKCKCQYCDLEIDSNKVYVKHLKDHLDEGFAVTCPLKSDNCSRQEAFHSKLVYSSHLSQCHPGWRSDCSTSALASEDNETAHAGQVNLIPEGGNSQDFQGEDSHEMDPHQMEESARDFYDEGGVSSSSSSSDLYGQGMFTHDQIVKHLASFYALLEGKLLVPQSTVDIIARQLSFISEILQDKMKEDLAISLRSVGLSEQTISEVIQGTTSLDPLYNSHHVNAPGVCLLTPDRRHTYFKRNFKYQQFIEINLCKNPSDSSHLLHYIEIKETLEIMLSDPTVQRVVDDSFQKTPSDGSVLKDYTDGSVFRNSNTPQKRIDLLVFMDAFNCVESLGAAKLKHKIHGVYMTIGNLEPFMRAYLKAIRLVLLVNDKSLKGTERMFRKCFERLVHDLKELIINGVRYKSETVPVRIQFIVGDNLGQHTVGGFVESFSAYYFCRYCEIHKNVFEEDKSAESRAFRRAVMRTPSSFRRDLQAKVSNDLDNCKGVKRDSPFNEVGHFNVCDPRLPPCIAHDLLIDGVVDCDIAAMLRYFIDKNWFTEHWLQMTIKGFKYHGNDSRNKPTEYKYCKKKLVGHAVQNWTLLRLLPLLIGDKVKPNNKVWKLYLLLKSIVELICAPALTREQVEKMRSLIDIYMQKRKRLSNKCKPKHHYFSHYPDLFLLFGPLIHLWTLAFEHRHQFFKRVARICRNFINLGALLASKFQYLQAYQNMGPLFPDYPTFSESSVLTPDTQNEDIREFLRTCNFSSEALTVRDLIVSDVKYKPKQWLLLNNASDNTIFAGEIELLVCDGVECTAIVRRHEAELWKQFGLYYVTIKEPTICAVPLRGQSENPCPHPMYIFMERYCFSLKHAFLAE